MKRRALALLCARLSHAVAFDAAAIEAGIDPAELRREMARDERLTTTIERARAVGVARAIAALRSAPGSEWRRWA